MCSSLLSSFISFWVLKVRDRVCLVALSISTAVPSRKCIVQLKTAAAHVERLAESSRRVWIRKVFITTRHENMAEAESIESREHVGHVAKRLTREEIEKMQAQDSRLVSEFRARQLERDAKKHWDLFYKRNEDRFFKDRHWTTREFHELSGLGAEENENVLLEIGCGVGNFIYPLIEDGLRFKRIFACDLSPRAVELTKNHAMYDAQRMLAFQTDVTTENCFSQIDCSVNVATLIFVLSAIHPEKFQKALQNLFKVLAIGGVVLFRDYGLYDMAQLRFKPGHKISENFYARQDGTRSYYFSVEEVSNLFESVGFQTVACDYVHRRTVNLKEKIDVPRIFVQGKFKKT